MAARFVQGECMVGSINMPSDGVVEKAELMGSDGEMQFPL